MMRNSLWALALSSVLSAYAAAAPAPATAPATLPATPAAQVGTPRNISDLKALQSQIEQVVKQALPATVGILMPGGQGSGIIVSKDGYILTAGHVSGRPGQEVTLILHDGKRIKGKTLGNNSGADASMIKITTPGEWPCVELGKSSELKPGQWVIALGHPGGYHKDRPPVLRVGRILMTLGALIGTDCTLIGGDSGGPLLNLDGRVVGIHSRIGASTNANMHVPVDQFSDNWDRLARGEAWGSLFAKAGDAMLGVSGVDDEKGARVQEIVPGTPVADSGLKVGDVITKFDGRSVDTMAALVDMVGRRKPGQEVKLEVLREGKAMELTTKLTLRK